MKRSAQLTVEWPRNPHHEKALPTCAFRLALYRAHRHDATNSTRQYLILIRPIGGEGGREEGRDRDRDKDRDRQTQTERGSEKQN